MTYRVHITRSAERDLRSAVDYMDQVLLNPSAADNLLTEAGEKIGELSSFPGKYALVDDPVLKAWGIRFTQAKNYLAFYTISDSENTVDIVRFLYGKRDWNSILKQGISLDE